MVKSKSIKLYLLYLIPYYQIPCFKEKLSEPTQQKGMDMTRNFNVPVTPNASFNAFRPFVCISLLLIIFRLSHPRQHLEGPGDI